MSAVTLSELITIHDDLRRCLSMQQPPAIAALLCARFLEGTEDAARGWWPGFAFHVALEMARRISVLSTEGIAPEEIARFARVLTAARTRKIPSLPGETEWPERCEEALAVLARASVPSPDGSRGPFPDARGTVEIRVPVIHSLAALPGRLHPLFADASVASILRLTFDADLVERGPKLVVDGMISPESRAGFEEAFAELGRIPHSGPRDALLHVRWTREVRLVGRSATFPFLLAAATARSRFSRGFTSILLTGDVAATGDLDGVRVRPVEPSTLAGKVGASFHAGMRTLLVPAEQESEARRESNRLAEAKPGRSLEVIGVRDAREAWRDRRIVHRHPRSPRRLIYGWLYWMTQSRSRIALVASAALLLALLSIVAAIVTRDVPTDVVWKGDDLLFRNRYGWITRRLPFPYEDTEPYPAIGPSALVIEAGGRRIALVIHGSAPLKPDRLAALDRRGRLLWEVPSTHVRGLIEGSVRWKGFSLLPAPAGHPEVLTVRRSTQHSLTLIDRIDARTGAILGELRNVGHLEVLSWVDPAREGKRRPAIMGTSNESGCGLVAILDPPSMVAPARVDSIEDIPSVTDPRSIGHGIIATWSFAKDALTEQPRVTCGQIADDDDGLTLVSVGSGAGRGVNYYLQVRDLPRPVVDHVQITDAYRAIMARIDPSLTPERLAVEETRLARSVRILTPDGWRDADFLHDAGRAALGR